MFFFGYIIVSTLYKGDKKYKNNHNNNSNYGDDDDDIFMWILSVCIH
jgi:L-rhamnose isomerase